MNQLTPTQPSEQPPLPATEQPPVQPTVQPAPRPRPPRAPRSRRNLILFSVLLLLGLLLTALFAVRATRSFGDFRDARGRPPRENVGDIAPWMSVPYVAAAYGVPPEFIFEQLQIPAEGNDRKPLRMLERTYRDGQRGLLGEARAAVELYYAGGVVPTPLVPDPETVPMPEGPNPGDLPRDGPRGGPDDGPPGADGESPREAPLPPADGGQP